MPAYKATEKASGKIRLIDAGEKGTVQQVKNHLLGDTYAVESVTTSELIAISKTGVQIEDVAKLTPKDGADNE